MTAQLECKSVCIEYNDVKAVSNFSMTLKAGEIGCLLGPSGCGKTTLLRAIAGFEPVTDGSILLGGRLMSSPGTLVAPEARKVGMVFQDFALFPHLTVEKNITFGIRKMSAEDQRKRLNRLLELIGMAGYATAYPHELSGGQQQRVALARAMATQPGLLLMDEPFSNLDADLREQLALEVRALLKKYNMTALMVTHDQQEAFLLADKLAVMKQGEMLQWGSPYNVYHNPESRFVADFIGQGCILKARVNEHGMLENGLGELGKRSIEEQGHEYEILVRPDDFFYSENSALRFEIIDKQFRGADNFYYLLLPDGQRVVCTTMSHINLEIGDSLPVELDLKHLVVLPDISLKDVF